MTFRTSLRATVAVVSLVGGSTARAQTVFFARSNFVAALGATQTNDLNGLANGATVIPFGALGTGTFSGVSVTGGQVNYSGTPFTFSISFSQLLNGFGADFARQQGSVAANFRLFNGATLVGETGAVTSFNPQFIGVVQAVAFDRIEISDVPSPSPVTSLDNPTVGVRIASTVPEPATIALVATGVLIVGGMARRRKAMAS